MQANFLQIQKGGHCFRCHEDITGYVSDHMQHSCREQERVATACSISCCNSKYYTPNFAKHGFAIDEQGAIIGL